MDRFVLDRAARLVDDAKAAYERYEFHTVAWRLLEFATTDLSALWCDVRKDALYVLSAGDPARRSAQTTALKLAETIALLLNPICPFTAEEIWESLPGRAGSHPSLETYETLELPRLSDAGSAAWSHLETLRDAVLKELEPLRRSGAVGTSAQATADVPRTQELDADMAAAGIDGAALAEFFVLPQVTLISPDQALAVRPAEGTKCPRCWQVRRDGDADGLCGRCRIVIEAKPPAV